MVGYALPLLRISQNKTSIMSRFSNFYLCSKGSFGFKLIVAKMKKLLAWIEIPANDMNRAVQFYNRILGIEMKVEKGNGEEIACFPTGEGAIFSAPGYKPSVDGVIVSFHAEKGINAAIARIEASGGTIVVPKTKIEVQGRGYFAVFLDPEGNRVGLYED